MNYNKKKEPMEAKYKRYWAIGIVLAVLAAALLIWNSGIFDKSAVAATVGDQTFTVPELTYYYNAQVNRETQQAQMYQQFGMETDYDPDLAPAEQYYDEESGVTYAQHFMDEALESLQRDTILLAEAKANAYTLSEEGKQSVEDNMDSLHMYSVQSGYSESAYLKLLYGKYMTKSMFEQLLENSILASEYAEEKEHSFTFSEDEIEDYYKDHTGELDSYDYRSCMLSIDAGGGMDEDGNPVQPTDEEIAAAMAEAKAKADNMVQQIQDGMSFNEAAAESVDETAAENYRNDENFSLQSGVMGNSLNSTYSEWLMDDSRQAGDVSSFELEGSGYYVIQFVSRERDDSTYQTATYRDLLVLSETTAEEVPVESTEAADTAETEDAEEADAAETEAEPVETETVYKATEEQLAAAKEKAEDLIHQWEDGDATSESFGELAQANSEDETSKADGGLHENANRDSMASDLSEWLFDEARKQGDTTILDYADEDGNPAGYRIIYFDSLGQLAWEYEATEEMQSEAYDDWFSEQQEAYPAELTEKGEAIVPAADVASEDDAADAAAETEEAAEAENTDAEESAETESAEETEETEEAEDATDAESEETEDQAEESEEAAE